MNEVDMNEVDMNEIDMNEIDARIYHLLRSAGEQPTEAPLTITASLRTRTSISDRAQIPLPEVRASLKRLMDAGKVSQRPARAGIGDDSFFEYWSAAE